VSQVRQVQLEQQVQLALLVQMAVLQVYLITVQIHHQLQATLALAIFVGTMRHKSTLLY
jgi:hypothetical protein